MSTLKNMHLRCQPNFPLSPSVLCWLQDIIALDPLPAA